MLWNTSPPRLRPEHAVVDVAGSAPDELTAIAVLVDAVQARTTTADRVRRVLAARSRLPRRAFLTRVAADLAEGTHSVPEHRYLTHVERRHRSPTGERQATIPGSVAVHDVVYRGARVVVELDVRAYHSVARARFADLERDAEALVRDHVTIRLGWAQVVGDPCGSARRLSVVLAARGWEGGLYRCPSC